jgi:CheY-like chemotaxis protein
MSEAGKQILIVDDDPDLGELLGEVLRTQGYRTALARNGREALALLKREHDACLVLLDLMMPVMNGWEFRAEQLRDPSIASIPVVAFSGDVNVERKAAALGAVTAIRKPVSLRELVTVVERTCGQARSEAP